MNDTIVGISTALGVGAISIIRVSGSEAINIVNLVFKEKNLNNVDTHTIHYGHIFDSEDVIDEVLVSVMRCPKTFTKEDVVEINCHGGIASTNKILETILNSGARSLKTVFDDCINSALFRIFAGEYSGISLIKPNDENEKPYILTKAKDRK